MRILQNANKFDLPQINGPKIHGETNIVLKNVKTGLVERIHSENTFQGSNIAKWLQGSMDSDVNGTNYSEGNNAFRAAPWKGLVGGLLLFRDSITEGTSFMPAGNVMVGKGAIDISNASEPVELGSYNSIESSASGSSITQVYDFSTSQANGTIGCVCLTSKEGGFVGYGNTSGKYYPTITSGDSACRHIFGTWWGSIGNISFTGAVGTLANDGKRYKFTVDYDNKILTVTKYRTCGITTGSAFAGLSTQTTHDLSSYQSIFYGSQGLRAFYCGNGIFRFLPRTNYSVSASGTIYYLEYNIADDTIQEKTLLNSSTFTVQFGSTTYYDYVYGGFTKDGRLIGCTTGSPTRTVVIDMTTGATVLISDSSSMIYSNYGFTQVSPNLYFGTGRFGPIDTSVGFFIDTVNGTVKPVDSYYSPVQLTNCDDSAFFQSVGVGGNDVRIYKNPLYLATINNLQSPVTKSAAQTMKVTYTLTEV